MQNVNTRFSVAQNVEMLGVKKEIAEITVGTACTARSVVLVGL